MIAQVLAGEARACIVTGDSEVVMREQIPDASCDSAVCDFPYGYGAREPTADEIIDYIRGARIDTAGDFMSKNWEIPPVSLLRELYRVLKPGAWVGVYAGTVCDDIIGLGMRAAGFEKRDVIEILGASRLIWCQGSGMAKHGDVGKDIDDAAGLERDVVGEMRYADRPDADGSVKSSTADLELIGDDAWKGCEQPLLTAPATPEAERWTGFHGGLAPKQEPLLLFRKPLARVTSDEIHAATGWDHWHVPHPVRRAPQRAAAEHRFGVVLPPGGEAQIRVKRALHAEAVGSTELRWRPVVRWKRIAPVATVRCVFCKTTHDHPLATCPHCAEALPAEPTGRRAEVTEETWTGPWQVIAERDRVRYRPWKTETLAAHVLVHGTGVLNIGASRVFTDWSERSEAWKRSGHSAKPDAEKIAAPPGNGITCHPSGRFCPNLWLCHEPACRAAGARRVRTGTAYEPTEGERSPERVAGAPDGYLGRTLGYGAKDGTEEIAAWHCLAVCHACGEHVVAPSGGDGPRCACGRAMAWACAVAEMDAQSGACPSGARAAGARTGIGYHGNGRGDGGPAIEASDGGASRFYPQHQFVPDPNDPLFRYVAKASASERHGGLDGERNPGVCVKPLSLSRAISKLLTPPGGVTITTHAGTGAEVIGAALEGFRAIGIEINPIDADVGRRRLAYYLAAGDTTAAIARPKAPAPPPKAAPPTAQLGLFDGPGAAR